MKDLLQLIPKNKHNSENIFNEIIKVNPINEIVVGLQNIYKKMYGINKDLQEPSKLENKIKLCSIVNGRRLNIGVDIFTVESYLQILSYETIKNNKYFLLNNKKEISEFESLFYFDISNFDHKLYKYLFGNSARYQYDYKYIEEDGGDIDGDIVIKPKKVKVNKTNQINALLGIFNKKKKVLPKKEEEIVESKIKKLGKLGKYTKEHYYSTTIKSKFKKDRLFMVNSKIMIILFPYMKSYLDVNTIEEYEKKMTLSNPNMELDKKYFLPNIESMKARKTPQEEYYLLKNNNTDELDRRLKEKISARRLKVERDVSVEEEILGRAIDVNGLDYQFSFIIDLFSLFENKIKNDRDTENDILRLRTMVNELSDVNQFIVNNYQKLINVNIEDNRYKMIKENNNLALFSMYRSIFYKDDLKIVEKEIRIELLNKSTNVPYVLKNSMTLTNKPSMYYNKLTTDINTMKEKVKYELDKEDNYKNLKTLRDNVQRFILNIIEQIGNQIGKKKKSKALFFDYVFRFINMHDVNRQIILNQKNEIYLHSKEVASLYSLEKREDDKFKNITALSQVSDILNKLNIVQSVDNDVINIYRIVKNQYT